MPVAPSALGGARGRAVSWAVMAPELDDRWRDLGEYIREQRRSGQLSLRKLSEMAGVSNPYLSQIERGLRRPSAEILQQIAGALQISAESLYVRAGILEAREEAGDLVAEIRRDPHISEEQKRTLVHIYESFRAARATTGTLRTAADQPDGDGEVGGVEPRDLAVGN